VNLGVVPVIPAAPIIAMCRRRGCTLPGWLAWLLHWPGLLAFGGGAVLLVALGWWWAYYW
jgi:hypothetical protein